jgi:hypothetical protein
MLAKIKQFPTRLLHGVRIDNFTFHITRVRFPMVSLEFFIDIILQAALWPLGSTQPLTEMSARNISWG